MRLCIAPALAVLLLCVLMVTELSSAYNNNNNNHHNNNHHQKFLRTRFAQQKAKIDNKDLIFSSKLPSDFLDKVRAVSDALKIEPDYLLACMAFETGETFSPSIQNAGTKATGLIQFMPSTATNLKTTTDALAKLNRVEQMDYVQQYFSPYTGKLKSVEDIYMTILWPVAVGKSNDYVLFANTTDAHPKSYKANKGLDANKDGKVTKAEAAAPVVAKYNRGQQLKGTPLPPENPNATTPTPNNGGNNGNNGNNGGKNDKDGGNDENGDAPDAVDKEEQ